MLQSQIDSLTENEACMLQLMPSTESKLLQKFAATRFLMGTSAGKGRWIAGKKRAKRLLQSLADRRFCHSIETRSKNGKTVLRREWYCSVEIEMSEATEEHLVDSCQWTADQESRVDGEDCRIRIGKPKDSFWRLWRSKKNQLRLSGISLEREGGQWIVVWQSSIAETKTT